MYKKAVRFIKENFNQKNLRKVAIGVANVQTAKTIGRDILVTTGVHTAYSKYKNRKKKTKRKR